MIRLMDDFTYWGAQREDNLTSLIPVGGDAREEFKEYYKTVFHKSNKLFVGFPFTTDIITSFGKLAMFKRPGDLQEVEEIPLKKEGRKPDVRKSIENRIVNYLEESLRHYYLSSWKLKGDLKLMEKNRSHEVLNLDSQRLELERNNNLLIQETTSLDELHKKSLSNLESESSELSLKNTLLTTELRELKAFKKQRSVVPWKLVRLCNYFKNRN